MSREAITKVVQRAISDAGFRRQLSTDPSGALRGFDLSDDEASALRTGDAGRLSALGVDQRMSKAFALGGAAFAATRPAGTDLSAGDAGGAATRFSDGTTGGTSHNALVENADANSALIDDGASGVRTIIPTEPGGNLTADLDGADGMSEANVDDSSEAYLTRVGYDSGAAANANADLSGGSSGDGTGFIDDSEGYLTKIGYDPNMATSAVTDAHDRGGDAIVTGIADDDAGDGGTSAASDGGPNITP